MALIPTRYPGSEGSADAAIRLARKTNWNERSDGSATGIGQRMFASDQGEYSLLDVRSIEFDASSDASSDAASEPAGQTAE